MPYTAGATTEPQKDAAQALAQALVDYDRETISLEVVTQKTVKLLNRLVDGLTNEAFGDTKTALANRSVPEGLVKKLKEVKSCLSAAVQSEVTLRKTAKLRGGELTHEQRKEAIANNLASMPYKERREWLAELVARHNIVRSKENAAGIDPAHFPALFLEVY